MDSLKELARLIDRHSDPEQVNRQTPIPGVRIARSTLPTEPIGSVNEPVFAIVAQGAKQTSLGGWSFLHDAGKYLVVSVDLPLTGQVVSASQDRPYLAAGLTLDPARIAALLLETANTCEDSPAEPSGVFLSPASDKLVEAMTRILGLLEDPDGAPVLFPGFERELLWRLLTSEQGPLVRQIGLRDSHLSRIGRAIRQIRMQFARTLRVDDLAQTAAMSQASFHRHFRAVTGMTPIQYQKQIRLQEARMRLLTGTDDVATVGFSVGYDSPSQFSREYSRLFGMPPGRDIVRLRSSGSARLSTV